jgi:hypothetical protein
LLRQIRRGQPDRPINTLPLSVGARSLLSALLEPNPAKRLTW